MESHFECAEPPCHEQAISEKSTPAWLWERLTPYKLRMFLALAATLTAGLLGTLDPLLIRHLVDKDILEHRRFEAVSVGALIALCYLARVVVGGQASLLSFRTTQSLSQDLRVGLLRHMTILSADWHERTFLGEKMARVEQDVQQVAEFGSDAANVSFRSVVFFVVNLVVMLSLNWRMALTIVPLFPIFHWVRTQFRSHIRDCANTAQASVGRASGVVAEHLGAVPQIQLLGAEERQLSRVVVAWSQMVEAQWQQRRSEIAFTVAVTAVMAIAILAVLEVGIHEYQTKALSIGTFFAFYTYITRIFDPISSAMELYSRTQRVNASIRRIREVLQSRPSVCDDGSISVVPNPLQSGLTCQDVCFSYSGDTRVLKRVSFHIEPEECLAIAGKSGCGKSTLSRLLARMAEPTAGTIWLEGRQIRDYTLQSLRRAICYVPQHPVLFSGTLRENLLFGNPKTNDEELSEIVDLVQLRPIVANLMLGLDTPLGPEAVALSGGERQRVALARGILRKTPILLLDEATSALDLPTEHAILNALAHRDTRQTLIIISHRLRSLLWADRIILFDAGEIDSAGTHTFLYRHSPLYRSLLEHEAESDTHEELTLSFEDALLPDLIKTNNPIGKSTV
ncbi:ABC transporter ATP-binding protein [Edaphobacter dinghuensis]|uniref:ABC transporter ATP-binding protein n=1 Tax=Edaphobacter dinghuensis TaxID=1560005 RepID=UPI00166829EF|nr:ABC transporter ATP-binding protein [Edaphobacter dinghuensis]